MDARAYYLQAAEAAATMTQAAARPTAGGEVAARASYFQMQQGRAAGDNAPPPPPPRHGQSLTISNGSGAAADGVDLRDLICPECGKVFRSDKAMYGHLRSHPAKGYKGATRPNPTAATGGGSVAGAGDAIKPPRKVARRKDQAAAIELSIKWPVTAKRGRLPLAPAGAGSAASSSSSVSTAVLESSFCSKEEEAAMILLQLSGFRGGTGEPEEELPVAVAESQIIPQAVDQLELVPADHVQDVAMLDAPEPEVEQPVKPDHVSGAGALLTMMPGHVSGGAALWEADKSALPVAVEHMFDIITESSLAAAIEQAKDAAASSSDVRSKKLGKLVVSDAKKPMNKRRLLHDIELQAANASRPAEAADAFRARRIPSPASNRSFVCPRCDKKFPTYQALGGHMASHNRGNKYGTDGRQHQQLVAQLAAARAVQSQSLMASQGGAVPRANTAIASGNTSPAGTNAAVASANTAAADASSGLGQEIILPPPPTAPILLAPPAVYPCSRCELIFPTGQALGGHKRRHWIEDKALAEAAETRAVIDAAAVEAVAAAASASAAPRGEPRDFDLNEMPGEE